MSRGLNLYRRDHSGRIRKAKQAQKTQERIDEFLKTGDFLKPNGKVNKTALAKSLRMNRKTVTKYLSYS